MHAAAELQLRPQAERSPTGRVVVNVK